MLKFWIRINNEASILLNMDPLLYMCKFVGSNQQHKQLWCFSVLEKNKVFLSFLTIPCFSLFWKLIGSFKVIFILFIWVFCLCYLCTWACSVCRRQKMVLGSLKQSYRWLWADHVGVGNSTPFSERTTTTLNY